MWIQKLAMNRAAEPIKYHWTLSITRSVIYRSCINRMYQSPSTYNKNTMLALCSKSAPTMHFGVNLHESEQTTHLCTLQSLCCVQTNTTKKIDTCLCARLPQFSSTNWLQCAHLVDQPAITHVSEQLVSECWCNMDFLTTLQRTSMGKYLVNLIVTQTCWIATLLSHELALLWRQLSMLCLIWSMIILWKSQTKFTNLFCYWCRGKTPSGGTY